MSASESDVWLDAAEVAARLGVKVETVYAYASRGLLESQPGAGRKSRFAVADVERLARRSRRSRRSDEAPFWVESAITVHRDEQLYYRGHDAVGLARERSFEQVAELLWDSHGRASWSPSPPAVAAVRRLLSGLEAQAGLSDRLHLGLQVAASHDPLRYDTEAVPVMAAARSLICTLVESLPEPCAAVPPGARVAERLGARLVASGGSSGEDLSDLLDAAMVLSADHGLSPSTLAVRVAASVRADPYSVVQTGMGVMGGALHGAASLAAEELLGEVARPGAARQVIGERVRRRERIPGFGEPHYQKADPRAEALLGMLRRRFEGCAELERVAAVLEVMAARSMPPPNIDFALAALARLSGMRPGASEVIVTLARVAGWIAHALEEYDKPTRFPRETLYIGPPV